MRYVVFAACIALFALPGVALDAMGWSFTAETGNFITKMHPVTYILAMTSILTLAFGGRKHWAFVRSSVYGPYFLCASALVLWSIYVAGSSSINNGAIGEAITSFFTPVLLLISLPALTRHNARQLGNFLRVFLVLNSLTGVYEYVRKVHIFPGVDDGSLGFRSQGLLGHPLSSALITGMMLVFLLTSKGKDRNSQLLAVPEIALHALAMFLFGSRIGLALVPIFITIGALLPGARGSRPSALRRITALSVVVIALALTQIDIPFIQQALARFTEDNGSANSRLALIDMTRTLDWHELVFGVDYGHTLALLRRFGSYDQFGLLNSLVGIENAWLALTFSFGLLFVIPLFVTLMRMMYGLSNSLDQSAKLTALYFFTVTAGSVAFAAKSLLICQLIAFIVALCQTQRSTNAGRQPSPASRMQATDGYAARPAMPRFEPGQPGSVST